MGEKEKTIEIEDYGQVVLKKLSWKEKAALKGKSVKFNIDQLGNNLNPELDIENLSIWLLVYSIKSLPSYPNFYTLDEQAKEKIVGNFGAGKEEPEDLGDQIFLFANKFNSINPQEIKKK